MVMTPIELLREVARKPDGDEGLQYILEHPVLLSLHTLDSLEQLLQKNPPEDASLLFWAISELRQVHLALSADPENYRVGYGPLEQLWKAYTSGAINRTQLMQSAGNPEIVTLLSPLYIKAISKYFLQQTQTQGDFWREAVIAQQMVLASLDAAKENPEVNQMQSFVVSDYIEIVQHAVTEIPDGRLYKDALNRGKDLCSWAASNREQELEGRTLFQLGVLNLDPYTAGYTNINYNLRISLWQRRLFEQLAAENIAYDENEHAMPQPLEALRLAEDYLSQAVPLRQGEAKGRTLKALAQAMEWRELLGDEINHDRLIEIAKEALSLLEPKIHPGPILALINILNRYDQPLEKEQLLRILSVSLDQYIRQHGPALTGDILVQALGALRERSLNFSPELTYLALELIHQSRLLFQKYGNIMRRERPYETEIDVLTALLSPQVSIEKPPDSLRDESQRLLDQANREHWDIQKLAGAFFKLSALSSLWDEEYEGLQLLHNVPHFAPLFASEYNDLLTYLRGTLYYNLGITFLNAEQWTVAIQAFGDAMQQFLELPLPSRALHCFSLIEELSVDHGLDATEKSASTISDNALILERTIGSTIGDQIQKFCVSTIAAMVSEVEAIDFREFLKLLQVAKGMQFAISLAGSIGYHWQMDEEGQNLLSQIEQLESLLGESQVDLSEEDPLNPDMLLTSYVKPEDLRSGDSASIRLSNMRHRYDSHLYDQFLSATASNTFQYLQFEDLQSLLDDKTILLNYYLGAGQDGRLAVHLLAVTNDEIRPFLIQQDFPSSKVILGGKDLKVQTNPLALLVASIREGILLGESGPLAVDLDTADSLEYGLRAWFGYALEYLEQQHNSGRNHLCIVPHGPLHYYPFHLLGSLDHPLAEDWIITYLPNLHMLRGKRSWTRGIRYRPYVMSAIGLSFKGGFLWNKSHLQQSIPETKAIADIFGVEPILEEQATEETVIDALQKSRYVHLSTHGDHNVEAPAFQCLYLNPSENSDGKLFAYELASLDLTGLDLLTLSACETALGRFDSYDNLRGIPANLILAGISTLIGTLWPVRDEASCYFFTDLYSEIKKGAGKLAAFSTAQHHSREQYPQYRDWGAFYFVGDWD